MMRALKKTQTSSLLILSLLTLSLTAAQDEIKQEDFSYQAQLNIDDTKSIQLLELPENVQGKLHHQAAQDLHIYDAKGQVQPLIIKYDSHQTQAAIEHSMVFFPLKAEPQKQQGISVSEQQNLAIKLEVLVKPEIEQPVRSETETQTPRAYIIENPLYDENIKAEGKIYQLNLELELDFEGIANLKLETGMDLNRWRTLVVRDSVSQMNFQGQQLNKNTISIKEQAARYLKLLWTGTKAPKINGIKAIVGQKKLKPEFVWSENLNLKLLTTENSADNSTDNTYEFKVSPSFHSNKLRLVTEKDNQIVSGVLAAARTENSNFYAFDNFQFYQIKTNENIVSVVETDMKRQQSQHWRVQFEYPLKVNIEDIHLQLNRYPASVYFLMQGEAPYTLAFGHPSIQKLPKTITNIMTDVMKISDKNYGIATISSIEKILVQEEANFNWKLLLLWSALLGGVLMMSWMARSLFKQMSKNE
ncbi:MAG: DUF3999 domain-containing protein [Gammaproteobacteria bacterium]|nr:DUF3999 domain-containing protein [Gammaproteobacteria bacterium]